MIKVKTLTMGTASGNLSKTFKTLDEETTDVLRTANEIIDISDKN